MVILQSPPSILPTLPRFLSEGYVTVDVEYDKLVDIKVYMPSLLLFLTDDWRPIEH